MKAAWRFWWLAGDRTLLEMAQRWPASREEITDITGVDQHKLERYGRAFLHVLENAGQAP